MGGNAMLRLFGVALLALPIGSSIAVAEDMKLPPLKKQATPQAVVDEHFDALNKRDWNRIMAQYPADYQLNLPDGTVVKGREAADKLFADFVKPHDQGGLCGIKFTPEQTFVVGETLNIQWKANRTKVPTRTRPTTGSWLAWSAPSKGLI
jgi:SnoaL-like protein